MYCGGHLWRIKDRRIEKGERIGWVHSVSPEGERGKGRRAPGCYGTQKNLPKVDRKPQRRYWPLEKTVVLMPLVTAQTSTGYGGSDRNTRCRCWWFVLHWISCSNFFLEADLSFNCSYFSVPFYVIYLNRSVVKGMRPVAFYCCVTNPHKHCGLK